MISHYGTVGNWGTPEQQAENRACQALVAGCANNKARELSAAALRAWRKSGQRDRAKWFSKHIRYIGYPCKF